MTAQEVLVWLLFLTLSECFLDKLANSLQLMRNALARSICFTGAGSSRKSTTLPETASMCYKTYDEIELISS
jgi:hypothetical protein